MHRILIVVNVEWYFWSHRLSLAKALKECGFDVIIAAAIERGYQQAIEKEGFRFIPLHLQRRSSNPWHEMASLFELFRLYRTERPDLVHHITIKPVLYGSLAAKAARVPAVINTIPGLGYLFLQTGPWGSILRCCVSAAYRFALSGKHVQVIVQNPDDLRMFVSKKLIPRERINMIRGSGVNIHEFVLSSEPTGPPIVLLASRLLWDKGVGELVEASRRLKQHGVECRVVIVGEPDPENPNSIPVETLKAWHAEGVVEWWGLRNDMPTVLALASIVVLPSYREGVPKILLEAAAAGRPIITTDAPGCREIVRDGRNGLLVPPRDPVALANAIQTLISNPTLRKEMGVRSREIAVAEFSEERVIRETLDVYRKVLGPKWPESSNIKRSFWA